MYQPGTNAGKTAARCQHGAHVEASDSVTTVTF